MLTARDTHAAAVIIYTFIESTNHRVYSSRLDITLDSVGINSHPDSHSFCWTGKNDLIFKNT